MKSLAERSITSVSWNASANAVSVGVLFVRAVLLARLIPVATFGIYAGASAIVGLTVICASFGMGSAFLHRAPETEDEEHAARVHFTLKLLFTLAWAGVMTLAVALLTGGATRTALLLLVATTAGVQLAETPRLVLVRRVEHRRLAFLQVATVLLTTLAALSLAWRGVTLWALLATDVATLVVSTVGLYLWRPVWRPRLAWSGGVVRYYLRFGARTFAAGALLRLLDRLDDVWTWFYLGVTPMGFYSRAFAFATLPRRILAKPVAAVASGTYAELKDDRLRLSQAFFRSNTLIVRAGFLVAGLLALVAPEFIRLLLGEKWMPMLTPFRWMLVFTMLDPVRGTLESLFTAVGRPGYLVRVRALQLGALVSGLLLLSPRWGIGGVAAAVTLMALVGTVLLLRRAGSFVDFSVWRLFAAPSLSLVAAVFATWAAMLLTAQGSDGWTLSVKATVYLATYVAVLVSLERREALRLLSEIRSWYA